MSDPAGSQDSGLSYSILVVRYGDAKVDLFVRRDQKDRKLYVFSSRMSDQRNLFSDRECAILSGESIGTMVLPDDKRSRNDLKAGDILRVYQNDGKPASLDGCTYVETL